MVAKRPGKNSTQFDYGMTEPNGNKIELGTVKQKKGPWCHHSPGAKIVDSTLN